MSEHGPIDQPVCRHCHRPIQEAVLMPTGMAPAKHWEHFSEAAYFTPYYHEAEPTP